jgi:hypothetical protein
MPSDPPSSSPPSDAPPKRSDARPHGAAGPGHTEEVNPASEREPLSPEPLAAIGPGWLVRVALRLRRALIGLADALVPAEIAVLDRSIGAVNTQMLGAAARLRIADLLEQGPMTAEQLAQATGTQADPLHRMLRALAAAGVFSLRDGRFENNRLSRALRQNALAHRRAWCEYFASPANLAAWEDLGRTLEQGGSAFERVHGSNVWEWFAAHPQEQETFARAMAGVTTAMAPVVASVFPWKEIDSVCDVGGGRGLMLSELLVRHPHLRGVLCDGAGVLESARGLLDQRGVADRVRLVEGDFFEHVPAGADAYLLKNVLHDWDDVRCLRILRTCHRAMRPGARLLIAETLCERDETLGYAPFSDVQMMIVCSGGRERGRAEYLGLVRAAGFVPGRVFGTPIISVIEGIRNDG